MIWTHKEDRKTQESHLYENWFSYPFPKNNYLEYDEHQWQLHVNLT